MAAIFILRELPLFDRYYTKKLGVLSGFLLVVIQTKSRGGETVLDFMLLNLEEHQSLERFAHTWLKSSSSLNEPVTGEHGGTNTFFIAIGKIMF